LYQSGKSKINLSSYVNNKKIKINIVETSRVEQEASWPNSPFKLDVLRTVWLKSNFIRTSSSLRTQSFCYKLLEIGVSTLTLTSSSVLLVLKQVESTLAETTLTISLLRSSKQVCQRVHYIRAVSQVSWKLK